MKTKYFAMALGLSATIAQAKNTAKADPVVTGFEGRPVMNYQGQCWTDMRMPAGLDACIENTRPVAVAPKPVQEDVVEMKAVPEVRAHFATNQARLSKGDTAKIRDVANTYATVVSKQPNTKIQVSGYADPTGSEARNLKLSRDRAFAARQALVKAGVPAKSIITEGRGETADAARLADCQKLGNSRAKQECLQPDRRAEISVQAR